MSKLVNTKGMQLKREPGKGVAPEAFWCVCVCGEGGGREVSFSDNFYRPNAAQTGWCGGPAGFPRPSTFVADADVLALDVRMRGNEKDTRMVPA